MQGDEGITENKRKTGSKYETLAVQYLEKQNVKILCRNYACRFGEIDIIGIDGEYLVFFEVKYRASNRNGYPEEAVGHQKQRTICKVADFYRMKKSIGDFTPMRFDVIAICNDTLTWYKDAFAYRTTIH